MRISDLGRHFASIEKISGHILHARLPGVAIGEICTIHETIQSCESLGRAQVIALSPVAAVLSMLGSVSGLKREYIVRPSGLGMQIKVSSEMLGTVLDADGVVNERLSPAVVAVDDERAMAWDAGMLRYTDRLELSEPMTTGIKAIDGVLTCAMGQRIGIFATAGAGKTSLLSMLVSGVDADVNVVALVGERGREVTEFVARAKQQGRGENLIVVFATSDQCAVERANAAHVAVLVAEFFRDQGKRVVLYVDSLTRYARAVRDIALAAGETPVKRGYPTSVFDRLPRFIERAGRTRSGSITAFYTVLLDSEDQEDHVADEFRSLLDGHIYLSRALAERHHYPAIEILKSASRLFGTVSTKEQRASAGILRASLAQYRKLEVYLDLGEYRRGQCNENDRVVDRQQRCRQFLTQDSTEYFDFADTLKRLEHAIKDH